MNKNIIFDLDGTIADTSEGIFSSLEYTISKLSLTYAESTIDRRRFIGPPLKSSFMQMLNLTNSQADAAVDIFRNKYKDGDIFKASLYPGMLKLLQKLQSTGYICSVATNKRTDLAVALLERLNIRHYFYKVCGGSEKCDRSKTEIMKMCIDNRFHSVMIGDSAGDAVASQENSIDFIGVTYGFGFETGEDVNIYMNIGIAASPSDLNFMLLR